MKDVATGDHGPEAPAFDAGEFAKKLAGSEGLAAFESSVREHRMAKFDAAFTAPEGAMLFDVARLEDGIASGTIGLAQVDIYSNGHLVRLTDLAAKTGRAPLDVAADYVGMGSTLRVRDLERSDTRLAALQHAVEERFAAEAQINLYLTPAQRQGFPAHFDTTDVFVVQVVGAKAWRLFADYTHRTTLPLADTAWDPERYRPRGEGDLVTLAQGDVLYIPRGGMHAAASLAEPSMHLTISLVPLTYADLLTREIARIAGSEEGLRRRVSGNPEAEAKALLSAIMTKLDVSASMAADAARRIRRPATGALRDALHRPERTA